jgi:hypothetical protein
MGEVLYFHRKSTVFLLSEYTLRPLCYPSTQVFRKYFAKATRSRAGELLIGQSLWTTPFDTRAESQSAWEQLSGTNPFEIQS